MHNRRLLSLIEIAVLAAASSFVTWRLGPHAAQPAVAAAILAALGCAAAYVLYVSPVLLHRETPAARGLGTWRTAFIRTDNLREAGLRFAALTLGGLVALGALAAVVRPGACSAIRWQAFFLKFALYWASAVLQSLVFFSFLLPRLRAALGCQTAHSGRLAASAALGLAFFVCHLPNLPLMTLAALYGFAAAWIFQPRPNLLPAVAAHAVLGTVLHRVVELPMRIGPFYWQSDRYVFRELFPCMKRLIGDLF